MSPYRAFPAIVVAAGIAVSCSRHGQTSAPRAAYSAASLASAIVYDEVAIAPDARTLAVISDESGARELWTATGANGVFGPLSRRTDANERIADLVWSPDSSTLLFAMDHGGDEKFSPWIWKRSEAAASRFVDVSFSMGEMHFSPDGKWIAYVADREKPSLFNVEVMEIATRKPRVLTHETINVSHPRWSRDGKMIAVSRTPDDQRGDILVIDTARRKIRTFHPPLKDAGFSPVGFLSDGRLIATTTGEHGFTQFAVVSPDGDPPPTRAGIDDWDVESAHLAESGVLVFLRNVHGESEIGETGNSDPVCSVAAACPIGRLAPGGVIEDFSIDRTGRTLVAIHESGNRPPELRLWNLAENPRREEGRLLRESSLPGVDIASLAKVSRRTVASFDGVPIDYYLWTPPVARMGTPPPLVMYVHGGPDSQSRGTFAPGILALTEAGIAVASANYRGSTGYGKAFLDLDNHDWGGGDLKDLLAVVDDLAKAGLVDPSRTGIMGGSFGGYMTLRALTETPDRFKAGVDLYGMADLEEDYRLTKDLSGSWYETEMGTPEKNAELYRTRSPIHSLDKLRAPLLVFQGANDTNVPRAESDAIVRALTDRKVPVEYVVFPNEGHGFTHRDNKLATSERIVSFFSRTLAGH